jgi:hypothetical protein
MVATHFLCIRARSRMQRAYCVRFTRDVVEQCSFLILADRGSQPHAMTIASRNGFVASTCFKLLQVIVLLRIANALVT